MAGSGFQTADATCPAYKVTAVTADVDIPGTRALYIGVTGNVQVITHNGDDVTFVGVPAGAILPVQVTRVVAASTTATNILALY